VREPLVIGLVSGRRADWAYVEPWYASLRAAGYSGEIALIMIEPVPDLRDRLPRDDITTFEFPKDSLDMKYRQNFSAGRFGPLTKVLSEHYAERFVLTTDVRDVVFQRDPFAWFEDVPEADREVLFAAPEEAAHDDGSVPGRWNALKIENLYDERIRADYRGLPIQNAGVICAPGELLAGVLRTLYLMCYPSQRPGGEQAAYAILLSHEPLRSRSRPVGIAEGWASNWGAIGEGAVPADRVPVIEDGLAKTQDGKVFHILHQYDRHEPAAQMVAARLDEWRAAVPGR
jgi:hypothetical protein